MDSLRYESAQEKPYLTFQDWQPNLFLPELSFEDMFESSIVYSPHVIKRALERAMYCLTHIPGPHLQERIDYADTWLGWWIEEMDSLDDNGFDLMKTYNVRDFDTLGSELGIERIKDFKYYPIPAVWFVAGLEGHEGHRFALDSILSNPQILPIIVFEQDIYMESKEREKPYLPLKLRMSMYSHYLKKRGNKSLLLINKYSGISSRSMNNLYEFIFEKLNAIVCLPNSSDSEVIFFGKVDRSIFLPNELAIPHLDVPSTTERVRV